MAQELYTRTNQKLYFAGLALEAWKRADAERAMNAQAIIQGERESALFHLYGAVLGVCHEIAGYYRLPQAAAPRVDALLNDYLCDAPQKDPDGRPAVIRFSRKTKEQYVQSEVDGKPTGWRAFYDGGKWKVEDKR